MPSKQNITRPDAAVAVAEQYLRRERPVSALIAALVVAVFLGTYLAASLVPALVVAAVLLVVVRAPILRPQGTGRLRTDADIETVLESFTGPTPPVLVFQWGIADDVSSHDSSATYRLSYLFGLRTIEMTVRTRTTTTQDSGYRVELDATANGQPWSTYTVTIHSRDDRTVVEYEYASNRRFGLRRVPQRYIADRYRDKALREQGYTVVHRD